MLNLQLTKRRQMISAAKLSTSVACTSFVGAFPSRPLALYISNYEQSWPTPAQPATPSRKWLTAQMGKRKTAWGWLWQLTG